MQQKMLLLSLLDNGDMTTYNQIVYKEALNDSVFKLMISVNQWAKQVKAGQFLMIRIEPDGERFPLTITETVDDCVVVIFKVIGYSTKKLSQHNENDTLYEVLGPLGQPYPLKDIKSMIIVGGGVGNAITYAIAKHLYSQGVIIHYIGGFKSEDDCFYLDQIKQVSHSQLFMFDQDSSYGHKGNVIDGLNQLIQTTPITHIFTAGPLLMMKAVVDFAKEHASQVVVSLNPIMVDGIGMCGGCRVDVDSQVKFACVDGPEFDGLLVDFDRLIQRNKTYEKHPCVIEKHYE